MKITSSFSFELNVLGRCRGVLMENGHSSWISSQSPAQFSTLVTWNQGIFSCIKEAFLFKRAFSYRLRVFLPEKSARPMLTPWNDLLFLLTPFQSTSEFSVGRSFVLAQLTFSITNGNLLENRGKPASCFTPWPLAIENASWTKNEVMT